MPTLFGLESQELLAPLFGLALFPYARFAVGGTEHVPRQGPAILTPNHSSYFDAAALAVLSRQLRRPLRVMAKIELFRIPGLGGLLRSFGAIPVDRNADPRQALRSARAFLDAGDLVVILPEGTIPKPESSQDSLLALKAGAVLVAKRAQVPLIPIGIVGTNHVWPVGARLPRLARIVHPSSVRLEIGAPLEVGANTKETLERLRLAITAQIELAERMELEAKRREERQ